MLGPFAEIPAWGAKLDHLARKREGLDTGHLGTEELVGPVKKWEDEQRVEINGTNFVSPSH